MTRYFWLLVPLFLTACNSGDDSIPENSTPIEVSSITNFNEGDDNWVASFSDYPVDDKDIFQLESGINEIPNSNGQRGFLLGGMNRSDDLFMFLKKQVVDLVPNTRYLLTVDVNFWSEAGNVCFGIGGSPGDSVYMKVGASEIEPAQADYYMNIDIGHQSSDGSDALVVGNVSVDGTAQQAQITGDNANTLARII